MGKVGSAFETRGRTHLPNADRIFERVAFIEPPRKNDSLPIFAVEAIAKDFYFPATEAEIAEALTKSRVHGAHGITHVQLRKPKASEFRTGRIPLAEYFAWNDIALLIFYPWPVTGKIPLVAKPGDKILNRYKRFAPRAVSHKAKWHFEWSAESANAFCTQMLVGQMLELHAEFQKQHNARQVRRGEVLDKAYAIQHFFEENLEYEALR